MIAYILLFLVIVDLIFTLWIFFTDRKDIRSKDEEGKDDHGNTWYGLSFDRDDSDDHRP